MMKHLRLVSKQHRAPQKAVDWMTVAKTVDEILDLTIAFINVLTNVHLLREVKGGSDGNGDT